MEWFEQWFDTDYYHLLYQNRDEKEAEVFLQELVRFLEIPRDARIIDIACGRGRHSLYLNELGFEVTGIDISRNSIDYAKKFENRKLRFICFDKRKPLINDYFDYGLNLFTSFGYLKDQKDLSAALKSMTQNLKQHGILVLDYLNSVKVRKNLPHKENIKRGNCHFRVSKEIVHDKVRKTIKVQDGEQTQIFHEEVHLINLEQFRYFFEQSGLRILHIFGNYSLDEYDADNSDRLILIGIKN